MWSMHLLSCRVEMILISQLQLQFIRMLQYSQVVQFLYPDKEHCRQLHDRVLVLQSYIQFQFYHHLHHLL